MISWQTHSFKPWLRTVALLTVCVFTFTSVVWDGGVKAYAAASSPSSLTPVESFKANAALSLIDRPDLPDSYGTIKSSFKGSRGQIILAIQDAHINEEAQRNIANILRHFSEKYQLGLVNLEGASGELYTELFSFFPDKEARRSVADYFLKEGRLTGPEYLAIVEKPVMTLYGVEDPELYEKNRKAYVDALQFKARDEEILAALNKVLAYMGRFVFPEEMRELYRRRAAFQESGRELVAYVRFLVGMAQKHDLKPENYSGMQSLIQLIDLEKQIDFDKAEKETDQLINDLKGVLSREKLSRFLTNTVHFRMKKMKRVAYYGYLQDEIRSISVTQTGGRDLTKQYANVLAYFQYMVLYDSIGVSLFDEIEVLEKDVKNKLFTTPEEIKLDHLMRIYDVMNKMFDFTLTKQDAEFYYTHQDEFKAGTFSSFLKPLTQKYHFSLGLPSQMETLDQDLPRVERFYQAALERDQVLVERAVEKTLASGQKISAIITGGFHTPGIEKYLQEKGFSYIVVAPRISKAIDQKKESALYDAALRETPLPIEKVLSEAFLQPKTGVLNDPRFQLSAPNGIPTTSQIGAGENLTFAQTYGQLVSTVSVFRGATALSSIREALAGLFTEARDFMNKILPSVAIQDGNKVWFPVLIPEGGRSELRATVAVFSDPAVRRSEVQLGVRKRSEIRLGDNLTVTFYQGVGELRIPPAVADVARNAGPKEIVPGLMAEMGAISAVARSEARLPVTPTPNADEQALYEKNLRLFHAAGFADPKPQENVDKQKAAEQAFRKLLLNRNFQAKLDALDPQKGGVGTQDLSGSVILRLLSRSSPEAIKAKIPVLREAISLGAKLKITTDTVSLTMDAINGVIAERKTALAREAEAAAVAERKAAPKREAEVAAKAEAPKAAEVTPAKPPVVPEAKPAEEIVPAVQEKPGIFKKAGVFWGRFMDKVNNGTSVALTPFVKVRFTLYRYAQGYRFKSAEGLSGISAFTRFAKKDKDLFIHQIRARTLGRTGHSMKEEELLAKIPSLRVDGKTPVRLEDLSLAQLEEVERAIRDLQVEKDFEQRQHMKEQKTLDLRVKSHKGIFYATGLAVGLLTGVGVAALISLAWPVLALGAVIGLMMTKEMANVTFVFIENVKTLFKSGSVAKGLLGVLFVLGAPLYLSIQLMSSFIQKLIYPIMYRIHGTGQRTYFVKIGKDGKVEIDPETGEAIVDVKALTDALNRRLPLVVGQTIEDYLTEKKDAALTALAEKAKELSRQAATTTGDWDQVNKELDQVLAGLPSAEAQRIRTLFDQHIVVQKRLQNVANHLARSDALHARIIRVLHLQNFLAKKITDFLGSKATSAKAVRYVLSDITNPLGAFFQWFVFGRGALFFKGIIAGAFILTGPIGTGIALALFVSYRAYGVYQIRKEKFKETLAAIEGKYGALPKTELNEAQKAAEIKKATRSYRVKTAGSVFGMAAGLGIAGYLLIGAFVAPDLISFIPHNLFSKQVVLKVFGDAVPLSLGTLLKDVFLGMIMAYGGAAKKSRAEHIQEKYFLEPVLKLMRSYGFKTMEASGFFAFSRTEGGKSVSTLTYEGIGQYFDAIGPEQRQEMAKQLGMDEKTFDMFLLSHLEMLRGMIVANVLSLNQNEQLLLLERINGIQAELAGRYTQDEIQKARETGRVLTSSAVDDAVATRMEINRMARYRTLGSGRFYLSGFTTAMGLITLAFEIPAVLHLFGSLDSVANQALKPLGIAEFHGFHTVAMFIERTLLGLFNNVWQGMWSLGGLVPLVAPEVFLNSALARVGTDIADRQVSHDIATLQARMTGMSEGTEAYRTEAGHLAELQAEKVRMTASPALARLDGELRKLPKSSVTALLARQLFSKVTDAVLDPNHAMSLEEMNIAIASVETVIRQAKAEAVQTPAATGEPVKVMQAGMVPNPLPLIEKVFSGIQSLFAPKTAATPQPPVQERSGVPASTTITPAARATEMAAGRVEDAALQREVPTAEAQRTELVTERQAAPAELQKLSTDLQQAVEEGKAALAQEGKAPTPYNIGAWLKANEAKYPKVVEKFQTEVMNNPELAAVMTGAAVPAKFTEQLKGRSLRALTKPVDDIFGPNTSAVLSLVAMTGVAAIGEEAATVTARPAPNVTRAATVETAAVAGPMGAAAEEARRIHDELVSKREEAELRLEESRNGYAQRFANYLTSEITDRITFNANTSDAGREIARSLLGRPGFIKSLADQYVASLRGADGRGDVSKLKAEDLQAGFDELMDQTGGINALTPPEIEMLRNVVREAILQRFSAVTEAKEHTPVTENVTIALPLFNEGQPVSVDKLLEMAIATRMATAGPSKAILDAMAKFQRNDRKFTLSIVARAGTDFIFKGYGVGTEVSFYLSDPTKNERQAIATYREREGLLQMDREMADVVRELRTHGNNYARARILAEKLRLSLEDVRNDEEIAKTRTREGQDTDAAMAIGKLRRQLERDLADRRAELEGILRSIGALVGVTDKKIILPRELEDPKEAAKFFEATAAPAARGQSLDLAAAQGKYALDVLNTSLAEARGKMGILFRTRIFFNPPKAFDFMSPLSSVRDPKTPAMVHMLSREGAALQYYQDAQQIKADEEALRGRLETAVRINGIVQSRLDGAENLLREERQRYRNESGWSMRFKAAVEQYDLAKRQAADTAHQVEQLTIEINRFTSGVSAKLAKFEEDFERDAEKVKKGESRKLFDAEYFAQLEAKYRQSDRPVDATELADNLAGGKNVNLLLEEFRAREVKEREIQMLAGEGIRLKGTVNGVEIKDLQKYEAQLFSEYERATSPKERDLFQKFGDLFRKAPRLPEVIKAEIEKVNKAKLEAYEAVRIEINFSNWIGQIGDIEARIRKAEEVLNSDQSTPEQKEKAAKDLKALHFTLPKVKADLQALKDSHPELKDKKLRDLRIRRFVDGGVEALGVFKAGVGGGLTGTWDFGDMSAQWDFFEQALKESELLQQAHKRDYVKNIIVQRQFLDQIHYRIDVFEGAIMHEQTLLALLEASREKEGVTPEKIKDIDRQIIWGRQRLSSFEEAKTSLESEHNRAEEKMLRIMGRDVEDRKDPGRFTYTPKSKQSFMEGELSEEELGLLSGFDKDIDRKVAEQRVRIQWAMLNTADHKSYKQLHLMVPFISAVPVTTNYVPISEHLDAIIEDPAHIGIGGSGSLRTYSGHLAKDKTLDIAVAEANLRTMFDDYQDFIIRQGLVSQNLDRQVANTKDQKTETRRLIGDLDESISEYEEKEQAGLADAGDRELYTAIRQVNRDDQDDNELIHQLNLRLLQVNRATKGTLKIGAQGRVIDLTTPENLRDFVKSNSDRVADSNEKLAQELRDIQEYGRYLRPLAISTEVFRIPLGFGRGDDFQAGGRVTFDFRELAFSKTQLEIYMARAKQLGLEKEFRRDIRQRLVELAWQDVLRSKAIWDIREQEMQARKEMAAAAQTGTALEDQQALSDAVIRTVTMAKTAERDFEIYVNMLKFIAGIPAEIDIQVPPTNLLQRVYNGEPIGEEVVAKMLKSAAEDPRFQSILRNNDVATAEVKQAEKNRSWTSQVGIFAGYHPSVGAEYTRHLIDRAKTELVNIEKAKKELAVAQQDPLRRAVQMQALEEYAAFVLNRVRLVQIADEFAGSLSFANDATAGYRAIGEPGRTVKTVNDVLAAFDYRENDSLRLTGINFEFQKSLINLSHTTELMGLHEEAQRVQHTARAPLPYQTRQQVALEQLQQAEARIDREAAEVAQLPVPPEPAEAVVDLKVLQKKLGEEKKPPVIEPRTDYRDKNTNEPYVPSVSELWRNMFGADTAVIERGRDGKVVGGLSEPVLVEDVFVRLFDAMRLTPNERLAMFEILKTLSRSGTDGKPSLKEKLNDPDFKKFMAQLPRNEKLGLNYAQLIEGLLSNRTLTAMNQEEANSLLDRNTDLRILGVYVFYATSILKGMKVEDINARSANVPELVQNQFSDRFNSMFSERLKVDFIFLTKLVKNMADQVERNKASPNGQAVPVIAPPQFTSDEIAFLTRDGLLSRLVDIKDRRVDFKAWAEQQKRLGSQEDDAALKRRFVGQVFLDWATYTDRQVSAQPYYKFSTLEDTFQEFNNVRKAVFDLYRANFGRDLGLYGDIKDLADITAWQYMSFMGKLYSPDKGERAKRLNTVILLTNYILENKRVPIVGLNGEPSAADPSAAMLRFLRASAEANQTYADRREVQKEEAGLRTGALMGEVVFRTIQGIEQYAEVHGKSISDALDELGNALPQGIRAGPLGDIRSGIDDYYRKAPEILKALDASRLFSRALNMKDPRDSGQVSAWYEYGTRYHLTIDELKQIIEVAGKLYPKLQELYGRDFRLDQGGKVSANMGIVMAHAQFILGVTDWHKEAAQYREDFRQGKLLSQFQLDTMWDYEKWETMGGVNAPIGTRIDARIKEYERRLDLMDKFAKHPKAFKGAEEIFKILYGSSYQYSIREPEEQQGVAFGHIMNEAYIAERDHIPYDRLAQRYENIVKLIDSPAFTDYLRALKVIGENQDLRTLLPELAKDKTPEGKAKLTKLMGRLTGAAKDLPADFEAIYAQRGKVLKLLVDQHGQDFEGFSTWLKSHYGNVTVAYPEETPRTIEQIEKDLYLFLQRSKYAEVINRNPAWKAQIDAIIDTEASENFPGAFVEGIVAGMPDMLKARGLDITKDDPASLAKLRTFFDNFFLIVGKFDRYPVVQDAGSLNMERKIIGLQESLMIADPDLAGVLQAQSTLPLLQRVSAGRMLVGTASFWLGRVMDSEAQRNAATPNYWLSRQAPGWAAKMIPEWLSKMVEENKYPESEEQYVDMKKVETVIIPRAKAAWEAYHGILEPMGYSITKADIMSVVLNTKEIEKVSDIQEYFEQCQLMLALALGRPDLIPGQYKSMIPEEKLSRKPGEKQITLEQQNLGRPLAFNEMQGYVIEFRRSLKMRHHSIVAPGYNGPSLAVQKMVTKFIFVEPSDPSKTYLNVAASAEGQDAFRGKYALPGSDLQQMADKRGALWEALPEGEKARTALLLSTTFLSRWPVDPQLADKDFFHFLMGLGKNVKDLQRLQEIARLGQDLEGSFRDEFFARNGKDLTYDRKMLEDASQFRRFLILRLMTRPVVLATPADFEQGFEARLQAKKTVPANRIPELVKYYVDNNHLFGALNAGSLQKLRDIKDENQLNLMVNDLKTLMQEIVVGDRLAMDPNRLLNSILSLHQDKTVATFKNFEENMLRKYLQLAAEKQEPLQPEDAGAPEQFVQGLSEKLSLGLTKEQQDAWIQGLGRGLLSPAQVRVVLTDLAWFRGEQQDIPADLRVQDDSLLRFIAAGRDMPLVHAGVIADRKPVFYSQEQLEVLGQLAGAQGVELAKQYESYFADNYVLSSNTRIQEETKGGKARPKLSDFLTERGSRTRQMGEFWSAWSVILPIFSVITTIFVLIAAFAVRQLRKAGKIKVPVLDHAGNPVLREEFQYERTGMLPRSEMRQLFSRLISTEEETMDPALAARNREVRREPLGKEYAPPYLTLRGAVMLLVHGAFVGLFLLMSWQVLELTNSNIFWNVIDLFESGWMAFMLSHILTAWLAGRIFPKSMTMGEQSRVRGVLAKIFPKLVKMRPSAASRDAIERPELDLLVLKATAKPEAKTEAEQPPKSSDSKGNLPPYIEKEDGTRVYLKPADRHDLSFTVVEEKDGEEVQREVSLKTEEGQKRQALPPGHKTSIAYFNFDSFPPPQESMKDAAGKPMKDAADKPVIDHTIRLWLLEMFKAHASIEYIKEQFKIEFGVDIDKKNNEGGWQDFFFLKNVIDSLAYNLDPYGRTTLLILAEKEYSKVIKKAGKNDANAILQFEFIKAALEYAREQVIQIGASRFGDGSVYVPNGNGDYTIPGYVYTKDEPTKGARKGDLIPLTRAQLGKALIYYLPLTELHFEKKQGNILSTEDYLMGQDGPPAATELPIPLLRFSGRVNDPVGAAVVNGVALVLTVAGVIWLAPALAVLGPILSSPWIVGAVMWLMGYFAGRAIMNYKQHKANLKPNKVGTRYFADDLYTKDSICGFDPDHLLRNRLPERDENGRLAPVEDSQGRRVQLFTTNPEGTQHIFTMDNKNRLGDNPDNPEYPNEKAFINVVRKLVEVARSTHNWAGIIIPRTKVVTERTARTFFTMLNDFASNHGVFYAHALQLIRGRGNFTGKALVNLHSHYHTGDARNMPSRWWTVLVFTLAGIAAGPIVFSLLSFVLPLIPSALPFVPGALSFLLSAPLMVQFSIGQMLGLFAGLWVSGKSAGSFGVVTIKELSHDYKEGDTTGAVFVDNAAILEPSTPTFFEMEGRSFVRWAQGDLMRVYDIFQPGVPLAARWMSFVAVLGYINPIIFGFWVIKRFFFDPSLSGMANMYTIMVPRSTEFLMTSCVMPQLWVGVVIGIVVALLIAGFMRRSAADAEQLSGKKALNIIQRLLMPGFLVALLGVVGVLWPAWLPFTVVLAAMLLGSFMIALILEWTRISKKMNGVIFTSMVVALVWASITLTAKFLPAFVVLPFPVVGLLFIGVLFVVIVFPVLFGSIQGQTWGKVMLLYKGTTTGLADTFLHIKRNFWENPWKLFMQGSQNVSRSWHLTIGTVIGNLIQWVSKPAMIFGIPVLFWYVMNGNFVFWHFTSGAAVLAAKLTAWSVLSPWGITGILGTLVAAHPIFTAFVISYLVLRYTVKFTRMIFIVMRDQQLPWATSFGTGQIDGAKSLLRTYMFYSPAFVAALLAIASGVLFHSNLFTFVFGITFLWSWSMAGWHVWLDQFKNLPAGYPDLEEGLGFKGGGIKRLGLFWVHVYRSMKADMFSDSETKKEQKGTLGWFAGWSMRISNVLFHVGFNVGVGLMIAAGVFLKMSAASAVYFWFALPMVFVIPALTGFLLAAPFLLMAPARHWLEFIRGYIGVEEAAIKADLTPSTQLYKLMYNVSDYISKNEKTSSRVKKLGRVLRFFGLPKKMEEPKNVADVDQYGNLRTPPGRSEVRTLEEVLPDLSRQQELAQEVLPGSKQIVATPKTAQSQPEILASQVAAQTPLAVAPETVAASPAVPVAPLVAAIAPSEDVTKLEGEVAALDARIKKTPWQIAGLIGTAIVLSFAGLMWGGLFLVGPVALLLVLASVVGVLWMWIRHSENIKLSDAKAKQLEELKATPAAPMPMRLEVPKVPAEEAQVNPPSLAEVRAPVYVPSREFGIVGTLVPDVVVSLALARSETRVLDVSKEGTIQYDVKLDGLVGGTVEMVFGPVSQAAQDVPAPSAKLLSVSNFSLLPGGPILHEDRIKDINTMIGRWTASMQRGPVALNLIARADAEKALSKVRSEARAVVDNKSRELVGKIHVTSGEMPALQEQLKTRFMANLERIDPARDLEGAEKISAMNNPQDIIDALSPLGLFGWQQDVPIRGAAWQMPDGSTVTFRDHQQVIFNGVKALQANDVSYFRSRNLASVTLDEAGLKAFVDSYNASLSEQEKKLLALALAFHDYGRLITTGPLHPVVGSELVKAILEKLGMDARTVRIVTALTSRELEYGALPWGETVPRKVVEGLPENDIPVFLKLMSFIYILDVAAVGKGKLTSAQLANARYLQSAANLERLQSNWASVRAAGFYEPRDGVILDLSQAIAEEAVPAEIRNELASNPDFKTFMETVTFQRIVYVFREMVRQGNPESVTKLVYALSKLQQLTQTDFISLSVDRKEYATKINELLKMVSFDQLKAADFRMEDGRFVVASEGRTVLEAGIQQSADKKVVVNVESIPARSELRTPEVQPAEQEQSAAAREQEIQRAIAAAAGVQEARFTMQVLPEIVNPLATRIEGRMIESIMQSLNVSVILSLKGNGLHIIEFNPADGFDGAYIAQRVAQSQAGSRFVVIAGQADEAAANEALKGVGKMDLRIGQVNSLLSQAVTEELDRLHIDVATAKANRNVIQAQVTEGVDPSELHAASALLNQFDGVVTVTGSRTKVSSAFQFTVAELLGAAIQAAAAIGKSA
ncbi:MAG: hypothetical protein ABH891_02875 [Candidatus Omnitrophota bacterium]